MSERRLQPPRGTRDFYPEDVRTREWLFGHFREISRRFGFEEVDAPVVEHAELFTRKAGEEIVEQLYHFELHDRHLALRPEITPSIARMVMARAGGLRLPLRWFSLPQCWRYERMTRGAGASTTSGTWTSGASPTSRRRRSSPRRLSPCSTASGSTAATPGCASAAARCWRRPCGRPS